MAKGKPSIDLLIEHAAELVSLGGGKSQPRRGKAMRELGLVLDGALAISAGRILEFGPTDKLINRYRARVHISAKGKTVLPGFVDPHTHPVFAKTREAEFQARVEGKSYLQIAKEGGGIISAVKSVRAAGLDELTKRMRLHLNRFLSLGTTTIEAKSGYGLATEAEIKSLKAIRDAAVGHAVEVVPTFLGAHEIPPEYRKNRQAYIRLIIDEMLPAVKKQRLAKYCDVFCEKGVFSIAESRRILQAAKKLGFALRLHADEFFPLGGAQLAAEVGAVSADHLVSITAAGIKSMRAKGTIAVLLPGTSYFVKLAKDAPARKLIDQGVIVSLATDFNPGSCFTQSMPAIMNLAAIRLAMTPAESITAATLNAAYAVGLGNKIGSFHRGKQADVIICDIPNHLYLAYEFGRNPVEIVIKKGKVVYRRKA